MSDLFGNHIVGFLMRWLICQVLLRGQISGFSAFRAWWPIVVNVSDSGTRGCRVQSHWCPVVSLSKTYEPPCGKTNNVVSEQVLHKPTCTSAEKS